MIVTLPWPHKDLSPNSRCHWAVKARHKAAARKWAHMATIADIAAPVRAALAADSGPIPLRVTFFPPDLRRRDWDNCIAQMKAAFDGVADALGVDDRRFVPTVAFREAAKPGRVEITLEALK